MCASAYSGVRQQRCTQHFHKVTFRRQSDTEDREGCDSFNRCLSPARGKHQPAVQELYISVHGSSVGKLYIHKSGVQAYYWIHFDIFICYFLNMENLIILALCLQPSIILLDFNLLALSDRLTKPNWSLAEDALQIHFTGGTSGLQLWIYVRRHPGRLASGKITNSIQRLLDVHCSTP